MSGIKRFLAVFATPLLICGCVTLPQDFPSPKPENYANAKISGYQNIRFWGDESPPNLAEIVARIKRNSPENPQWKERLDLLALSGGGEDGAYGAGFLKGWTDSGKRPEFFMFTGISTGALIAPFAFLGPRYDDTIRRFYTETSSRDIFVLTPLNALFGGAAVADTTPLRNILAEEINDALVAEIARESRRGRLLLIGTTHLDAQRPMIWNIGAIAESGHPDARTLIGNIMLASVSIPGAFPPVIQEVMIDGKRHQETHVDGGVTNQIFVYPSAMPVHKIQQDIGNNPAQRNFWLTRNTKIDPVYETTALNVANIASRSISTLIKYQGRGDLIRLERLAMRDNARVRMTYVPQDFDVPLNDMFDPVYMKALYQVGYQAGLSNNAWHTNLNQLFSDKTH